MTTVLGRGPVGPGPDRELGRVIPAPGGPVPVARGAPARPDPGRLRRLWVLPAAVVVAGALALVPTGGEDGPGPGEAEVRVEGMAVVARDASDARDPVVVTDTSVRLGPGDVIEVTTGRAHFALDGGVTFEGRSGPAVAGRHGTTVAMGMVPELVAGPLLVVAPVPVTVQAAGSEVTVAADGSPGAARLDRRLGLGIGAYRGTVEIDTAGRSGTVAALRRMEVARPGDLDRRGLPLEHSAEDRWDRRFLAPALLVDALLGPLLDAAEGAAGESVGGSEALVAGALAELGRTGTSDGRVAAVRRFRADGASWGLVAMDQGVVPAELIHAARAVLFPWSTDGEVAPVGDDGPGRQGSDSVDGDGPDGAATGEERGVAAGPGGPGTSGVDPGPGAAPGGVGSVGGPPPPGAPDPGRPPEVVPVPSLPAPPDPGPGPGRTTDPVGQVVEGLGEVVDDVGQVVEGTGETVGQVVTGLGDLIWPGAPPSN